MKPSVGIVGGGILGMTAAYRLAQAGVAVSLYERAPDLGGLVGSFDFDGTPVDRFYHVVLPERRSGRRPRRRARPRRQVALPADEGRLLRRRAALLDDLAEGVPHLPAAPPARARAAGGVRRPLPADQGARQARRRAAARSGSSGTAGAACVEKLWKPLLDSKFDGHFDDLPGHLHLGADAPDGVDARQERPRGHGLARGRLPDADRRPRAARSSPWAARYTQGRPSSRSPPKAAAPSVSSSTVASSASTTFSARLAPPMARRRARARARRAGAGRPLPLPRRRLPAAPRRRGASARTTT